MLDTSIPCDYSLRICQECHDCNDFNQRSLHTQGHRDVTHVNIYRTGE